MANEKAGYRTVMYAIGVGADAQVLLLKAYDYAKQLFDIGGRVFAGVQVAASIAKMIGIIGPDEDKFATLYKQIDERLRNVERLVVAASNQGTSLMLATWAGTIDSVVADIDAWMKAQGKLTGSDLEQRYKQLLARDGDSSKPMSTLDEDAYWQRLYDPGLAPKTGWGDPYTPILVGYSLRLCLGGAA